MKEGRMDYMMIMFNRETEEQECDRINNNNNNIRREIKSVLLWKSH